jgi:hypothetical protein
LTGKNSKKITLAKPTVFLHIRPTKRRQNMRDRNGVYTNQAKEQRKARALFVHSMAAGYADAARSLLPMQMGFSATGAEMLDRSTPHRVVGRKLIAKADGLQFGKAMGRAALWAGVDLTECLN